MLDRKSTIFALVIITLATSAKRIGMEFLNKILGKSLMYARNNKGPRIDPHRTQCEIIHQFEEVVLLQILELISIFFSCQSSR